MLDKYIYRFTGCTLPNYPEHGRWIIYGSSSNQFLPGNIVAPNTVLKIECRRYYTLTGDKFVICDNGHWLSGIGLCLRMYSLFFILLVSLFTFNNCSNCRINTVTTTKQKHMWYFTFRRQTVSHRP